MSRGPGRCQRAVMVQVESAPGGKLTRRELEDALVKLGFTPSNILRVTRGLVRKGRLELREGPDLDRSVVRLRPRPESVSDDKIFGMLAELRS
jgi:hypothetical protein